MYILLRLAELGPELLSFFNSALEAVTLLSLAAGTLPPGLSNPNELVVLDLHSNQLSGTLSDFAFAAAANREDIHSTLRYLDLGNNTFSGAALVDFLQTSIASLA